MIRPCTCRSEYQDKKYGEGQRVQNQAQGSHGRPAYTCTVCGTKRDT